MVCVDTTFLADLIRKDIQANKKLVDLTNDNNKLCTTIINLAELFYGAYKATNSVREKEKIKLIQSRLIVLDFDEKGAEKFGELMNTLDKAGQKVADRDVMIAAIALTNEEQTIVTRNKKDFDRIPSMTVLTY